jgi:hypothetical protein
MGFSGTPSGRGQRIEYCLALFLMAMALLIGGRRALHRRVAEPSMKPELQWFLRTLPDKLSQR